MGLTACGASLLVVRLRRRRLLRSLLKSFCFLLVLLRFRLLFALLVVV